MNPDDAMRGAPSLPLWASVPTAALITALLAYMLLKSRSSAEQYLLFACWLRYLASAFHEYSYVYSPFGLKWIAVSSIGLLALGILVLDKRRFFIWAFFPVAIICALMLVSGFINHNPGAAIEPITRMAFFAVISVAFWQALDFGGPRVMTRLLSVFLLPISFQLLSIALGVVKAGESDGSASYIGGYGHEQVFSLILASCFVVASFATHIRRTVKALVSIVSLIGIALANYRTTILGVTPLLLVQIFGGIPAAVRPEQRNFVRTTMLILGIFGLAVFGAIDRNRFADLATVTSSSFTLIKPPQSFTVEERRVLSSRPYIWSNYIYAYKDGTAVQKIVGFGPDSWTAFFRVYAHNTVISYLYELGILGVAAILFLWAVMAALSWRAPREVRPQLLGAHASFFVLNMATMPHWQIEGNILYALICGYTLAQARARHFASGGFADRWRARAAVSQGSTGAAAPVR